MDWKCPIIPVTRLRAASKLPKGLVLFVLTAQSPLLLLTSCILFLYKLTCQLASQIIILLHPVPIPIWGIIKVLIAKRTENQTFCDWKVVQALIEADLPRESWVDRIFRSCLLTDWLWARGMGWRFPDGILPISSYLHNFDNPAFLYILSEGTYRKDFWKLSRVSSPKVSFLGIFHALPKKWNYGIWNKWECRQFIFSKELL